jgi:hypothetical protein
MSNKEKAVDPGVDVQIMTIPAGGIGSAINVPSTSQTGNGVVVMPLPQASQYMPQSQPAQPTVIVITVGAKEKDKKEKKSSSVFQRL